MIQVINNQLTISRYFNFKVNIVLIYHRTTGQVQTHLWQLFRSRNEWFLREQPNRQSSPFCGTRKWKEASPTVRKWRSAVPHHCQPLRIYQVLLESPLLELKLNSNKKIIFFWYLLFFFPKFTNLLTDDVDLVEKTHFRFARHLTFVNTGVCSPSAT